MSIFNRIRGTKDIYPPLIYKYEKIEKTSKTIFSLLGYNKLKTPTIEEASLFKRTLGEESDIINKEMYVFKDRKERLIALRPEGTASVVRALIENGIFINTKSPWKFYYSGNMFRYERPQRGRSREFFQIGAELFGIKGIEGDFEIIRTADKIVKKLNIDFTIYINYLGCNNCRENYIKKLKNYLEEKKESLCEDCRRKINTNTLRILDCKKEKNILKNAPNILNELCENCNSKFSSLKKLLKISDIDFKIEPYLVRGLDYYTGAVFEFKTEELGAQDAILAGGRYDNLVKELGGPDIPATGFAIGVDRVAEVLKEEKNKLLEYGIIYIGENAKLKALELFNKFLEKNISFTVLWGEESLKSKMRKASSIVKKVILIGEEELSSKSFTIKDFLNNKEEKIKEEELLKWKY